jgi:Fe-S cluster biogenesis protein NfuA
MTAPQDDVGRTARAADRTQHDDIVGDDGERIELLLAELHTVKDQAVVARVDELVGRIVHMYGEGLSRIVSLVGEGERAKLGSDELVSALLLLHGLHPDDVAKRIEAALDRVRPRLEGHAGGVTLVGVEEGIARVRMEGACSGCASSRATVQGLVERAIEEAAPEIVRVEVVEAERAELIQLGRARP